MAVQGKFYVSIKKKMGSRDANGGSHIYGTEIEMEASMVDEDNKDWSQYTPMGKINMTITNEDAEGYFEPGELYTVTFRKTRQKDSE